MIHADTGSVQSQANKDADLIAKKAGDLALATVHLFTNNINPTPQNVVGDFTEPTFTGYAAQAVAAWDTDELGADGSAGVFNTAVKTWVGPGDATGQTVYGYFLRSAGVGTPLVSAVKFAVPQPLMTPADVCNVVPYFRLP